MIVALMSIVSFAQAADPGSWRALGGDAEATLAFRLHEDDAGGDVRRLVVRATLTQAREYAAGELFYSLDCRVRTATILGVRSLDADGTELQAVAVPEEYRSADPVHAGDEPMAAVYAELCPGAGPLPEPPPAPPPPIAVSPRG